MPATASDICGGWCSRRVLVTFAALSVPAWLLLFSADSVISSIGRTSELRKVEIVIEKLFSNSKNKGLVLEGDAEMFRYVFDWIEKPTATCHTMQAVGGSWDATSQAVDGDKRVCLDSPPLTINIEKKQCLIYSFGVGNEWSFDETIARNGCEVHAFDPTVVEPASYRELGIHFYPIGISMVNGIRKGMQFHTLDRIMDMLGHTNRTIQYLKIDVDGGEYDLFTHQFRTTQGRFVLDRAEQIALEIHLIPPRTSQDIALYEILQESFAALHQLGFRVVYSSFNPSATTRMFVFPGVDRPVRRFYELLAVKLEKDVWDRKSRGIVDDPEDR